MYVRGVTIHQISKKIEDIYGFQVSRELVSDITYKYFPKIEE